jgi:hypothetical protein
MATFKKTYPHLTGAAQGDKFLKYRYVYMPIWAYGSYFANKEDTYGAEDILISAASGEPSPGEIHTLGITGLHMDADGDATGMFMPIPADMDVNYDCGFRCYWVTTTDGTDTCHWVVNYTEITTDAEALAAGATALSTAIADDTSNGQYYVNRTEWGILNGGTLTDDRGITLLVYATDADEVIGTGLYLLGVEMRYVRRAI